MGFILKKILSAILMPLSLGLILFLIGLWFLYLQSYKKAKICLTVSFLWIFIVSYNPFANSILLPLESNYQKMEKEVNAKYILLLGGGFESRSYESVRLYHKIHGAKIITSGYSGLRNKIPEAVESANKLIELGIPKVDILMQVEPKDTQEEAQNIRKIVGNEKFILVTSAYHMPRAMELFRKEGLNPLPAPTNFLVDYSHILSVPNGKSLQKTEIVFHEYLGKTWNKLKSYKAYFFD